jgi:tRNA threonylcarbamoyladenosine biosynthesis protein TsaE
MQQNYSLEELSGIAQGVIKNAKYKILLLEGEMGVGKTTLIKELVKQLGSKDNVSSPTFSLVNEYHTTNEEKIYHFDFYRIDEEEEALDMGVEEYFYSGEWCLIEWPNKIKNLLPLKSVSVLITVNENQTRTIQLTTNE